MGQLPKSFIRLQANTLLGVWSSTSTDRSLFDGVSPQRFMKLPGWFSEGQWPRATDSCLGAILERISTAGGSARRSAKPLLAEQLSSLRPPRQGCSAALRIPAGRHSQRTAAPPLTGPRPTGRRSAYEAVLPKGVCLDRLALVLGGQRSSETTRTRPSSEFFCVLRP